MYIYCVQLTIRIGRW